MATTFKTLLPGDVIDTRNRLHERSQSRVQSFLVPMDHKGKKEILRITATVCFNPFLIILS